MRKIFTAIASLLIASAPAYALNAFQYQATVMNSDGSYAAGKELTVRLSVVDGEGNTAYSETHDATTDNYGNFGVMIGRGTGRPRNRTEENQTTDIQAVRNGGVTESDYPLREIRESKGERLRAELLTGRGSGKAGPVHQLHTGTARLQHPVENVPQRPNRASGAVPEPFYLENESDTCIMQKYLHVITI